MKRMVVVLFVVVLTLTLGIVHYSAGNLEAKLTADDGATYDRFGSSVAISGNTIIVGAYLDDDKGTDSGSVYVFVNSETGWNQEAKLTADDGAAYDQFGSSVAISENTVIVGAYLDDDKGTSSGSVYVFGRRGTDWNQQEKLLASDGVAFDYFGITVAIHANNIVVGATGDDDKGTASGSVYTFRRRGTVWDQQAKLIASDGAAFDNFGRSISIHANIILVAGSGSVYVFVYRGTGWGEWAKFTASDGAAFDCFGSSVCIHSNIAVVGAPFDNENGLDSGSAYLYARIMAD